MSADAGLSTYFWLAVGALLLIVVVDAIRDWREGEPTDLERDWGER